MITLKDYNKIVEIIVNASDCCAACAKNDIKNELVKYVRESKNSKSVLKSGR